MKVYYVEFAYPGFIVSDTSERRLSNSDEPIVLPERAFGYRKFWREEEPMGDDLLIGPQHSIGGWVYAGTRQTLADIPDTPTNRILRSNMECNNWPAVVLTKFGQAFPLKDNDAVIAP